MTVEPPIMGWSSWNCFRQNINHQTIIDTATAIKKTGLKDAGYRFINLDDCWQSSSRNEQNDLQFDLTNFSKGEKIIQDLHDEGFLVGLYSSCGCMTCEDLPASYGYELRDAKRFVEMDIDYLKYDYCHVVDLEIDERGLKKAPVIDYIELVSCSRNYAIRLIPNEAQLSGEAFICEDANMHSGTYIAGLSENKGKAVFTGLCIVPDEYVLTIGYKKEFTTERLMVIADFEGERYPIRFPTSSGWSSTGREQMTIQVSQICQRIEIYNPVFNQKSDALFRYQYMKDALEIAARETGRKQIIYEVCEHGRNQPWEWANKFAHSYRIGPDISANWQSVLDCYERAVEVSQYAIEGSYANPDMLEVGNGTLTKVENQSHFSLWAFLSAPLILGNDIRSLVKEDRKQILSILTNKTIIEINQAAPFLPAKRLQHGNLDILVKHFKNGKYALGIFNKTEIVEDLVLDLKKVGISLDKLADCIELKDVWHGQSHIYVNNNLYIKDLQPHETRVIILNEGGCDR